MEKVTSASFSELKDSQSKYVKPFRFNYTQNGSKKNWDLLDSHGSVAILIFNVTRKTLIFVKQFRPAVYFNSVDKKNDKIDLKKYPPNLGVTLELCAGIIDKDKPLDQIAAEEVLEECGYKVDRWELERIISFRGDVGAQGAIQVLYYCEVIDSMKVAKGGGIDNELIEIVEMPIEEVENLLLAPARQPSPSPPAFFFALTWFLHFKAKNYRN
ncbi:hypothetical protein O0L34_g13853 [Tuta absoluta]|nr:hypothetical protein O0L34_g13853 [Tuta absoluta]